MVWFAASSPTRTHTLYPGVTQSAESLHWHWLVWSERKMWRKIRGLQIANSVQYYGWVLTFNIPTVASFPNVTFGAACCAALWPSAGAVFYYHVVLPNTLQCMHFAHIQKNWFSTHSSSTRGAHIQRWTAYKKKNSLSNTVTTRTTKWLVISGVNIPALKGHFANTFASGRLLPWLTFDQGHLLCWSDCRYIHT